MEPVAGGIDGRPPGRGAGATVFRFIAARPRILLVRDAGDRPSDPSCEVVLGRVLAGLVVEGQSGRRVGCGALFVHMGHLDGTSLVGDARLQLVVAGQDVLAEVAGPRWRPLRFSGPRVVDGDPAERCARLLDLLDVEVGRGGAEATSLVAEGCARLLASALLDAVPDGSGLGVAGPGTSRDRRRPSYLHDAMSFIAENVTSPIVLADVAAAVSVSPRALQIAFRQHLRSTPMAYLRHLRLQGVHAALVDADPARGATVADVAMRWGFTHQGRFAALYRSTFQLSPRETLHG